MTGQRSTASDQCPMVSSKLSWNAIKDGKQDLISYLPAIVTEKILKRLPLKMAAKMSVLSRKWKDNWFSQRHLVFDTTFWEGEEYNYGIISSIFFHHNGIIHEFHLDLSISADITSIHLSQWLSFLSKTNVKKITLIGPWFDYLIPIPSHIFLCKELVKLRLEQLTLNPPPRDFNGFTKLQSLVLCNIKFKHSNMLASLIASCPRLIVLKLELCIPLGHLSIDLPSLESLVITGSLECLSLKGIVRLNNITLWLNENPESGPMVLNSISDLATSCQLQYLHFGGYLCEHLAAGGVTKLLPLSFNYLSKLCLSEIKLGWVDVYRFVICMIQSCPYIKVLEISGFGATPEGTDVFQREIDYDDSMDSYKLGHLTKVEFTGITGSSAELKFIEYLLAISEVLELFLFKCKNLDATSELKVSRDLLRLRRASTKAQLICMKYY